MSQRADFPILMYHGLLPAEDDPLALKALWGADPQMRDAGARLYTLDVRVFQQQMEQIAALRLALFPGWEQWLASPPADGMPWITFDDGHASNAALACPILERLNLRAIFFITTDWIDTPGFMTAGQIRHLHSAGMLIGSHGCSHRYFSDLTKDELRDEMTSSRRHLEDIIKAPVQTLSLPGGRNHDAIRELARQSGYRHVFTSRPELARPDGDPLDWPRIALTNTQSPGFLSHLLKGDQRQLRAMRRSARLRGLAKRVLGNKLYDSLRGRILRRKD